MRSRLRHMGSCIRWPRVLPAPSALRTHTRRRTLTHHVSFSSTAPAFSARSHWQYPSRRWSAFSLDILQLWLGTVPPSAALITSLLSIVLVFQVPGYVAAGVLLNAERATQLLRVSVAAAVVNIVASVAWTLAIGITGPAIGSLTAVLLFDTLYLPWKVSRILGRGRFFLVAQRIEAITSPDGSSDRHARSRARGRCHRWPRHTRRKQHRRRPLRGHRPDLQSRTISSAAAERATRIMKLPFERWYGCVTDRLPPDYAARLDHLRPSVKKSWGGPLNGQEGRQKLVREVARAMRFDGVVETGTYRGTTADFLLRVFGPPIYTVELDPRFVAYSKRRFRKTEGISVIAGDSRVLLSSLLSRPEWDSKALFIYLDAHWNDDLPLVDELRSSLAGRNRRVVMVDDFESGRSRIRL